MNSDWNPTARSDWNPTGVRLEPDWNPTAPPTGTRLESDWNSTGIRLEPDWNPTGQSNSSQIPVGFQSDSGQIPVETPVRFQSDSSQIPVSLQSKIQSEFSPIPVSFQSRNFGRAKTPSPDTKFGFRVGMRQTRHGERGGGKRTKNTGTGMGGQRE